MQTITVSIKGQYAMLAIILLETIVIGLLAVWLSESRLIINCASLNLYGINPTQFIKDHPQYTKRLDRNHDGTACNRES